MLKLYSRLNAISSLTHYARFVAKVSENSNLPMPLRKNVIFISKSNGHQALPDGFKAYFVFELQDYQKQGHDNVFLLSADLGYITEGDVVTVEPQKPSVRVNFRKDANYNAVLVTENCNNYCLMCSQPPRNINDRYLVDEILKMIPLVDPGVREIGITGGEPTLLDDDLIKIFNQIKNYLPKTGIHVLTNGRAFINRDFVKKIAALNHHDLMFGIPLYSDVSSIHDYVVQAENAFNETIKGIVNLKTYKQKVEVRVVLHQQTYKRLPQLAEFITRNLLFADHVALMGLEMTGFTKANLEALWVDPFDYQAELAAAIDILNRFNMNVSIYNHQLCLLPKKLWPFARKSISDWKNEYMPECDGCMKKNDCGGFFSSAHYRYSENIEAILS